MKTISIAADEFEELKNGLNHLIERDESQRNQIKVLKDDNIKLRREINDLKNTDKQESIRNLLNKIQSSKRIDDVQIWR